MFTSPLPWRVCKRSDNKSRERFAPCFCCSGLVSAGHDLEFQHALCCGGDGGLYAAARRHLIRSQVEGVGGQSSPFSATQRRT